MRFLLIPLAVSLLWLYFLVRSLALLGVGLWGTFTSKPVKWADQFESYSLLSGMIQSSVRTTELEIFFEALSKGNLVSVKLSLDAGTDVNSMDSYNQTPLMYAANKGNLPLAQLLVQKGAHVNATDKLGRTPLMLASYGGYIDIVRLLVDHGAILDEKSKDGNTALSMARQKGQKSVVQFLKEQGAKT